MAWRRRPCDLRVSRSWTVPACLPLEEETPPATHTEMQAHTDTQTHSQAHGRYHKHKHVCTATHVQTQKHSHTQTRAHTNTCAATHTQPCARRLRPSWALSGGACRPFRRPVAPWPDRLAAGVTTHTRFRATGKGGEATGKEPLTHTSASPAPSPARRQEPSRVPQAGLAFSGGHTRRHRTETGPGSEAAAAPTGSSLRPGKGREPRSRPGPPSAAAEGTRDPVSPSARTPSGAGAWPGSRSATPHTPGSPGWPAGGRRRPPPPCGWPANEAPEGRTEPALPPETPGSPGQRRPGPPSPGTEPRATLPTTTCNGGLAREGRPGAGRGGWGPRALPAPWHSPDVPSGARGPRPHSPGSCRRPRASRPSARGPGWSRVCRSPAASPPAAGTQVGRSAPAGAGGRQRGPHSPQIYVRQVPMLKFLRLKECSV